MIRYFFCFLLTLQQLFSLHFNFYPFRMRNAMAFVGGWMLLSSWKSISVSREFSCRFRRFVLFLSFFLLIVLLSSIVNSFWEPLFFRYPISIILSFLSAYCFLKIVSAVLKRKITYALIMKLFVAACLLECIISFVLFISPNIRDVVFSMMPMTDLDEFGLDRNTINGDELLRIVPLGFGYWGTATILALTIFFISILIVQESKSKYIFYYLICVVIIASIGAAIARTTLTGLIFFLFYLFWKRKQNLKTFKKVSLFICIILFLSIILYFTYIESNPMFELAFHRAFSIFYEYQEAGEMQSASSMFGEAVIPYDIKTWIIGDARMADPLNPALFYKTVDIGYWRLTWGYGIMGLLLYCLLQFSICHLASFKAKETILLLGIFAFFMYKGVYSFDSILAPFVMCHFIKGNSYE